MGTRLHIVGGPSGGGASTIAAALAVRLAHGGSRTLAVSIGAGHATSIGRARGRCGLDGRLFWLLSALDVPAVPVDPERGSALGTGTRLGRGTLALLDLDAGALGDTLEAAHGPLIGEIVGRSVAPGGPLAPLAASAPALARLALVGLARSAMCQPLLSLLRLATADGPTQPDDVVVDLSGGARLADLHAEPEAMRRRIDELDVLQAAKRYAARASGQRGADAADALLTRLASEVESLWGLLRTPASDVHVCAAAHPAAVGTAVDVVSELARQGIPARTLVVTAPGGASDLADEAFAGALERARREVAALQDVPSPRVVTVDGSLASLVPGPRAPAARALLAALRKQAAAVAGETTWAGGPGTSRSRRDRRREPPVEEADLVVPLEPSVRVVALAGGGLLERARRAAALATRLGREGDLVLVDTADGALRAALPRWPAERTSTLRPTAAFAVARDRFDRATRGAGAAPAPLSGLLDLAPTEVERAIALHLALAPPDGRAGRTRALVDLGTGAAALDLLRGLEAARAWLRDLAGCIEGWTPVGMDGGAGAVVRSIERALADLADLLADPAATCGIVLGGDEAELLLRDAGLAVAGAPPSAGTAAPAPLSRPAQGPARRPRAARRA